MPQNLEHILFALVTYRGRTLFIINLSSPIRKKHIKHQE